MGEVYLAGAPRGKHAAVKFLRAELADDPEVVARFRREAKIASALRSPHVASVLDAGKTRGGELWIAFEYLEGESLAERLKREGALHITEVAWIGDHVLQGLWAAHAAGVVHRDIKPGNIFLVAATKPKARCAKILDFGVSKSGAAMGTTDDALTALDATLGSFSYMPPEQIGGSALVDARADLYSFGVVVFAAMSGSLPFAGSTSSEQVYFKRTSDPLTLADVTGETWPAAMETFVRRILARDAKKRFENAATAREAWARSSAAKGFPNLSARFKRGAGANASAGTGSTGSDGTEAS